MQSTLCKVQFVQIISNNYDIHMNRRIQIYPKATFSKTWINYVENVQKILNPLKYVSSRWLQYLQSRMCKWALHVVSALCRLSSLSPPHPPSIFPYSSPLISWIFVGKCQTVPQQYSGLVPRSLCHRTLNHLLLL